jgi:hypothetical protein
MRKLMLGGLVAVVLTACASSPTPPSSGDAATTQPVAPGATAAPAAPAAEGQAYPAGEAAAQTTDGYPAPQAAQAPATSGGYPAAPTEVVIPEGPAFTIDEPVTSQTQTVTGTGPSGVPIRLVNITRNAEELGRTVIGDDGTFSFTVSDLPSGENLGLMIGDLEGTEFQPIQFLRGPGYEDIPQLGILFDQVPIQ